MYGDQIDINRLPSFVYYDSYEVFTFNYKYKLNKEINISLQDYYI